MNPAMTAASIQLPHGAILQREMTVFGKELIKLSVPGQEVVATIGGAEARIEFLKHRWSGIAEIRVGDAWETLDLFSEIPCRHLLERKLPAEGSTIVIRAGNAVELNTGHIANEVWIGAINTAEANAVTPLTDRISVVKGQWGNFMALTTDTGISRTILQTGVWAEKDIPLFRRLIQPGMTVWDIGANLGHHTVVFSQLAGKNGRVHAFEPQGCLYKLLNANLALNHCVNARAHQLALGRERAKLRMWFVDYNQETNFGALGISHRDGEAVIDHGGEAIDAVSGDEFLSGLDESERPVGFIKIDVQSFELYVLQGLKNILRTMRPALFLEISPFWMKETGYDYSEIYRFLWGLNYEIFLAQGDLKQPVTEITRWGGEKGAEWDIVALPGEKS